MFKHYLLTAWRSFLRYKLVTTINVLGLTLGFACFLAATGTISYLTSADRTIPNVDRIAMVWVRVYDAGVQFRRPFISATSEGVGPAIAKEFPELEGVTRYESRPNLPVSAGDRRIFLNSGVVDANYLDVLNLPRFQTISGNPLAVPRSVVLSESAALQLFDSINAVGRSLRLRDALDVTVTAVLKPLPRPTNFGPAVGTPQYDMLLSRDTRAALAEAVTGQPLKPTPIERQWGWGIGAATYVVLPKDGSLSIRDLEVRLQGLAKRNGAQGNFAYEEFRVVPLSKAYLAQLDLFWLRSIDGFTIQNSLVLLALMILGVACASYAHLTFAQAQSRLKETGLRRSIGASLSQLAVQAFVEAACHIVLALVCASAMAASFASVVGQLTDSDVITPTLGDSTFWTSVVLCIALVTVLCALYPALTLARVKAVNAVQASRQRSVGTQLLMSGQFAATGALIVLVLFGYLQNGTIRERGLQAVADPVLELSSKWQTSSVSFDVWRTELLQSPAIRVVSATENPPWSDAYTLIGFKKARDGQRFESIAHAVAYDYDKAVDLKFLAGRPFDRRFADFGSGGTAIVDESLSRQLGYAKPQDAIGKLLAEAEPGDKPVTIIGVIENKPLRIQPFVNSIGNVYFPFVFGRSTLIVRLDKTRVPEGLRHVDAVWNKLNPAGPVDRHFTDEAFQNAYEFYSVLEAVLSVAGSVALVVSLLGALGFALFVGEQRAHEIGVRKTLGASARRILGMLLRDFSKPILFANLLAWPFAYLAVQKYLSIYLERVDVTMLPFVGSLLISLVVVWLAIAKQAYRAAKLNPATVLRHE